MEADCILFFMADDIFLRPDTVSPWIIAGLIIILIFLFLSALISASEAAFFSIKPEDKKALAELNNRNSERVLRILKNPEWLLSSTIISNTLVNLSIVIISAFIIANTFTSVSPVPLTIFGIISVTIIILLFGEIIPRIYASHNSFKLAMRMSRVVLFAGKLFHPFSKILIKGASAINKKLSGEKSNISLEELSDALDLTSGVVYEDKKILKSILRFSYMEVSNIMQPRLDIVAVDIETDFHKLVDIINKSGFSRLPVYTGTFDNINGVLSVKDLLPYLGNTGEFSLQKLIRPCYYVPQTKKIKTLLQEFLEKKIHMAVVVDEYGGTEGIVTLEDVLEEIVGDITDESDEIETYFTRIDDRNYLFDGKTLLNDFYRILQIPEESFFSIRGEADTIAGLILEIKGEIPRLNEVITLKNFSFTIVSSDTRRIKKIKVTIDKPVKSN